MMNSKSFTLSILTLIVLMCFSCCVVVEKTSRVTYFIDNQSSIKLNYEVEIDGVLTDLDILPGERKGIYTDLILGGSPWSPNEQYDSWAEYIGNDIFLYRDSSGIKLEALQLNSEEDLNWIRTISDDRKDAFDFDLIVRDDMIE